MNAKILEPLDQRGPSKILLTKEERKELVVLHSNASHGPWAYESNGDDGNFNIGVIVGDDDKPITGYVEDNTSTVVDVVAREVEGSPNAAFIVEAYNIFPRLIYSLELLEARTEQVEHNYLDSISMRSKMAASIEELSTANKGLAERAQRAETRAEHLAEKLANALKVNAAGQMEAAVKLFTGLTAAMTGAETPADMSMCYCPHCGKHMKTLDEAALHDAVCEKHPAVIAAVAAEGERDWLAEKLGTLHSDCPLKHIKRNPLGWKCHEGAQGPCTKAQAAACWKEAASYGVKEKSEGD